MGVVNYKPSFHLGVPWQCKGWADILAAISVDSTSDPLIHLWLLRDTVTHIAPEISNPTTFIGKVTLTVT
jgi:hypothetical protein